MPNFNSLAGPEVAEKFVVGGVGGFQVSNLNPSYFDNYCYVAFC